jgi:DNA replication and repair protein RecF
MRLCQLKLRRFRNYAELDFTPGEGINILYGANAQGKTNVLEALSLLATTRSLRASRESELIERDADIATVVAEVDREREGSAELQVSVFQGDKKEVRVNGSKRARVVDLLGQFNAVFFGSIDLEIITGEPADRRHYLNVEISQISPRYVYDLGHYKRVLAHRNRLLRDLRERPRPPQECGLDIWNEQLVRYGAPIFEKRQFYVSRLAPLADEIHRELSDGREGLEVRYLPSLVLPEEQNAAIRVSEPLQEERYLAEAAASAAASPRKPAVCRVEAIAEVFRAAMQRMEQEEARRGTTLLGPQRDDLAFYINGADARLYGSQGQQRTVALALKLAEFRLIEDFVGEPPVMLLDDVMSDLDDTRRRHLLHWVQRRCQTFITCTNLRSFPKEILAEATTFRVVAGTVTPDAERKTRTNRRTTHAELPGSALDRARRQRAEAESAAPTAGDSD